MSDNSASQPAEAAPANAVDYFARAFWQAAGGPSEALAGLGVTGSGSLPGLFAVSDFASAAIGAAGLAIAERVGTITGRAPRVEVDRRLASFWFGTTLRPQGWAVPPLWDAVAGDYRAADGWIRLHTNAPHHRDAALAVLGVPADREAVARAVATWDAVALETAVVERNGCAAAMRTIEAWAAHPQGQAVWREPLLHRERESAHAATTGAPARRDRPLAGIRVLDLTRILAGPVATRFLAGFGADVLRIDPYGWEEPGLVPEVVLGKRCARLNLKDPAGRAAFERLLAQADILVHGYRPDALVHLGLDAERRRRLNPALIDVSLDAYGWTGPWRARRGFDSLVQMSTGIADACMRAAHAERPVHLPLQALDHATGYLLAAAAVRGLTERSTQGTAGSARASLARTAKLLIDGPRSLEPQGTLTPDHADDLAPGIEATSWGHARRIGPPVTIGGGPMQWDYPASALGTSDAAWH